MGIERKYKDYWESYDEVALAKLFAENFEYWINGSRRFTNLTQLKAYWRMNMIRQDELDIVFHSITESQISGGTIVSAGLYCSFIDKADSSIVYLNGNCVFHLNKFGLITKFEEVYTKTSVGVWTIKPISNIKDSLKSLCDRVPWWFELIVRWAQHNIAPHVVLAVFGGLALSIFMKDIGLFDAFPDIKSKIESISAVYAVYGAAILSLLQKIVPAFGTRDANYQEFSLEHKSQLRRLREYMAKADYVRMVSGNFSFLVQDKKLAKSIKMLAAEGKITLYSYCSEDNVKSKLYQSTTAKGIIDVLEEDGKIFYNVPINNKITLIESGGIRNLTYRFSKHGIGYNSTHMGIVVDSGKYRYVVDAIDRMLRGISGEIAPPIVVQSDKRCGWWSAIRRKFSG